MDNQPNSAEWYSRLAKPAWAPPSWVFGPVWTALYIVIFVSFGNVLRLAIGGAISGWVALPFVLNLGFNFAFTPLQFGLRSNRLALIDITLVLATLIWAMAAIAGHVPWVAVANIPYLVWVSFATALQAAITRLNG